MNADSLYEEACIAAAELVGPNSVEFDNVVEEQLDLLLKRHVRTEYQCYCYSQGFDISP